MTTIRPSARIRLTLRTEEFESTAELESRLPPAAASGTATAPPAATTPPTPTTPATSSTATARLAENQEQRVLLETRRTVLSAEAYQEQIAALDAERERILSSASSADQTPETVPPESVAGSATDDLTVFGDIEPVSVQVERNGLASADTATIVLDYADAPIDPQILRAAHVEAVLGVVDPRAYEDGMERNTRRDDGSLTSLVASPEDGSLEGATRFVGFVDSWAVNYSDSGDIVTLECRDMSAILRDLKLPNGVSIDMSLPIDQGVSSLLESVSATTRGIEVTYLGEGTAPTPADTMPTRRRARRGRVARRARVGGEDMTVWDHITDVVRGLGLLPVVVDFAIQITEPRTLTSSQEAKTMIYGRNLSNLEFLRKLQGVKVPTIEARSYDPDEGHTLWARYPVRSGETASGILGTDNPPRPLRANEVTPSGANPDESVKTIIVSGIVDTAVLERVAQNAFDQIGRQEIEGAFSTFDSWSYDTDPLNSDLLNLRAGDAIEVLAVSSATPDEEAVGSAPTFAQIRAMNRARRSDYLVGLGWNRVVADRFAALQEATGYQTIFRVQDVKIGWDNESGYKMDVSFINFITVREEG